jgi:dihydrofolate synthase/folylpolyglutamate synthase
VPLVCLDTPEPAYQAILEAARQAGAPVTALGEDNWRDTKLIENLIDFSFRYGYHCTVCAEEGVCIHARLRGTGLYQRENASLATAAALLLADRGLEITADQIRLGLEQAFWAGRMEEKRPGLWLDGAHNPDGIRAFLETVRAMELPDGASRHLLFSAVRDKRYGQMLRMLAASGLFRTVLAVPMSNYRSVTLDEMKQTVEDTLRELPADRRPLYRVMDSVEEALEQMLRQKKPGDLCFVCGSLYLVGIVEDLTVI